MDIIKMARELGAAIQADERFIALQQTRAANEADANLTALIGKINLSQMSYQNEADKENPDEKKLAEIEQEYQEVCGEIMLNKNMRAYEAARHEIDDLMNYVVQILSLCVNGEDPETCEPPQDEHNCGGGCSSCSGC